MNLKPNLTNNSFLKLIPFPIRNQLNKIRYKSYNRFYQNKSYKCSSSHMFWFSKSLNFGDWITPYLFEKIRGEKPVFSAPNPNSSSTTILSVGSIISESQPNSIRINDEVLKSLPNLICTPHIGGNSKEAIESMGTCAIDHILKFYQK